MADHAIDLGIDELLGNDGTLFRIRLIVFTDQFELDLGATDFQGLSVQVLDRQTGTVFVVLAEVGLRAGHRGDVTNLDDDFRLGGRRGRSNRFRFFFLTAGGQGKCGNYGEGNYGKLGLHRWFS